MRVGIIGAALALALTAGCVAPSREAATSRFGLSDTDRRLAQSLGHYAQALVYEREEGPFSDGAFKHYSAAAENDPSRLNIGAKAALLGIGRQDAARSIQILLDSASHNPKSPQPWLDLGAIYQALTNYPKAVSAYRKAISLDRNIPQAYVSLASVLFRLNWDRDADRALREGFRNCTDTSSIAAYCFGQGREFLALEQPQRAVLCFRILADTQAENSPHFHNLIGEIYSEMGDRKQAEKHFLLATRKSPPLPDSFIRLALLYLQDDPQKAVATLLEADRIIPNHPTMLFVLGTAYSRMKRYREAIAVFERVESLVGSSAPGGKLSPAFYLHYGGACERSGDMERAEKIFEKCLDIYPDADEVLNYLAYMWAEAGVKLDRAREYVARALEKEPSNGAYVDTLGWILFKQGKYEEALPLLEKAYELAGHDAVIADHVADTYMKLGNREKAVDYWKKSLQADPLNGAVSSKLSEAGVDVGKFLKAVERKRKLPSHAAE